MDDKIWIDQSLQLLLDIPYCLGPTEGYVSSQRSTDFVIGAQDLPHPFTIFISHRQQTLFPLFQAFIEGRRRAWQWAIAQKGPVDNGVDQILPQIFLGSH